MKRFGIMVLLVLAAVSLYAFKEASAETRTILPLEPYHATQLVGSNYDANTVEQAAMRCLQNIERIAKIADYADFTRYVEAFTRKCDEFLEYARTAEKRRSEFQAYAAQGGADAFDAWTGGTASGNRAVEQALAGVRIIIAPHPAGTNALMVRIGAAGPDLELAPDPGLARAAAASGTASASGTGSAGSAGGAGNGGGSGGLPPFPPVRIDPDVYRILDLCEYRIVIEEEPVRDDRKLLSEIVIRTLQKEILTELLSVVRDRNPGPLPYLGLLGYTLVDGPRKFPVEFFMIAQCR